MISFHFLFPHTFQTKECPMLTNYSFYEIAMSYSTADIDLIIKNLVDQGRLSNIIGPG